MLNRYVLLIFIFVQRCLYLKSKTLLKHTNYRYLKSELNKTEGELKELDENCTTLYGQLDDFRITAENANQMLLQNELDALEEEEQQGDEEITAGFHLHLESFYFISC